MTLAARLDTLSARQHRSITPEQARAGGLTDGEWRSAIRLDLVTRVFHGVYVVGAARLTQRELIACAQLRCAGMLLGSRSVFEARKCLPERLGRLNLWVSGNAPEKPIVGEIPMLRGRLPVLDVQSYRRSHHPALRRMDGVPLTTVSRAFVDLAADSPADVLGKAWREAELRGLIDVPDLRREASLHRPGSRVVSGLLKRDYPVIGPDDDLRSTAEAAWFKGLAARGFPEPELNPKIVFDDGYDACPDQLFREWGVAVEIDPRQHDIAPRDRSDKLKSGELQSRGLVVLQFATLQLLRELDTCFGILDRTLRLRGWPGPDLTV